MHSFVMTHRQVSVLIIHLQKKKRKKETTWKRDANKTKEMLKESYADEDGATGA